MPQPVQPAVGVRPARPALTAALSLFLLAPLVGEFLLGNLPVTNLLTLIVVAPFYGGGAVLIREVTRRLGLGWPSLVLMALAYAIVEEGVVLHSLFNPELLDLGLIDYGHIGALGISGWWTIYVLTIHAVWSIAVPIALVESLTPYDRRHQPWLSGPSTAAVALLYLAGCALNYIFIQKDYPYTLSPSQWIGTLTAIILLVGMAVWLGRRPPRTAPSFRRPPSPATVRVVVFALGSAFMSLLLAAVLLGGAIPGLTISGMISTSLPAWLDIAALLATLTAGGATLVTWSGRPGWDETHRVAVASGLLLTYAWYGIAQQALADEPHAIDILGNVVLALGAVVLAYIATRRSHRRAPGSIDSGSIGLTR